MPIKIKIRDGYTYSSIREHTSEKEWSKGELINTVTMADGVGYAVILTEHGEFDLVNFHTIIKDNQCN